MQVDLPSLPQQLEDAVTAQFLLRRRQVTVGFVNHNFNGSLGLVALVQAVSQDLLEEVGNQGPLLTFIPPQEGKVDHQCSVAAPVPQKHFEDKAQLRFCYSGVTLRVKEFLKSRTGKAVTQLRQQSPVTVDLLTVVNLSAQRIVRPVVSKRNDGLLNQLLGQKIS